MVPVLSDRSSENRGTFGCVRSIGALDTANEKLESAKVSFVDAVTSDGVVISVGATGCGCATTGAGAPISETAATAAENCGVTRSRDCVKRRLFGRSGS